MTNKPEPIAVEMVPVNQIIVANPRIRNKKVFQQLVDSISKVGLKKPITVNRSENTSENPFYELVCGQGRLEAFIALGEPEIPAIVIDVPEEDRRIMSLVENLAGSLLSCSIGYCLLASRPPHWWPRRMIASTIRRSIRTRNAQTKPTMGGRGDQHIGKVDKLSCWSSGVVCASRTWQEAVANARLCPYISFE